MHLPSKMGYKGCYKEFTGDTMGTCTETQEHTKSPSSPTAAPLGELEVGEGAKPELHLWMWATKFKRPHLLPKRSEFLTAHKASNTLTEVITA